MVQVDSIALEYLYFPVNASMSDHYRCPSPTEVFRFCMKNKTMVCVLASTSAGNCTVLWNENIAILVDCGTNVSYTQEALARLGLSINKISAVFITHCHGDHVNRSTLKKLVDHKVPVYCNVAVAKAITKTHPWALSTGSPLVAITEGHGVCEGFSYVSFSVPHDSTGGCFGYSFFLENSNATHKISIATDIGHAGAHLVPHFADSNVVIIESNHDVDMLEKSSRPQWLKDRITKTGHLSNDKCSEFIREVLLASSLPPTAIMLAHISQECNTNAKAKSRMHDMLAVADKKHVTVVETYKEKPSVVICVS